MTMTMFVSPMFPIMIVMFCDPRQGNAKVETKLNPSSEHKNENKGVGIQAPEERGKRRRERERYKTMRSITRRTLGISQNVTLTPCSVELHDDSTTKLITRKIHLSPISAFTNTVEGNLRHKKDCPIKEMNPRYH